MSTRIQRRGGTAAEHEAFTGAPREITVDTTNNTLRLHDGATAGGHPVLMKRDAGEPGGFRNKIINGDFEIWQRGESGFGSTGYCADRWYWRPSTGGTGQASKAGGAVGGYPDIPGSPKYYIYLDHSVAGTESCYLEQRIEGVETLAGEEVTLTAYVKPDAATDLAVVVWQSFGSGGTPSAVVSNTVVATTSCPGGAWTRVQARFAMPSVAGKTLGTNGDDYVSIRFSFDPAAVFVARIAHVSLVRGDATVEEDPFTPRHLQQELDLCMRYYEASRDWPRQGGLTLFSGDVTAGGTYHVAEKFKVRKRAFPTVSATFLDGVGFSFASAAVPGVDGVRISSVADTTRSEGFFQANWTADAEL